MRREHPLTSSKVFTFSKADNHVKPKLFGGAKDSKSTHLERETPESWISAFGGKRLLKVICFEQVARACHPSLGI